MKTVFIGVGSNIEPRIQYIGLASQLLKSFVHGLKCSPIYLTKPWGNPDLNPFLNAVFSFQTELPPHQLLLQLQCIEKLLGRKRTALKWQNRTIDLDILDYQDSCLQSPELILPHPYIALRPFVIIPWFHLSPEHILANHVTIHQLYNELSPQQKAEVSLWTEMKENRLV